MSQPFWEVSYANLEEAVTFGEPAQELIELVDVLPIGAKVLDLGCGEGRNALFLAGKGLKVKAVDISRNGIDKLNRLARKRGLSIKAEVCDMKNYSFESDCLKRASCLNFTKIGKLFWHKATFLRTSTRAASVTRIRLIRLSPKKSFNKY